MSKRAIVVGAGISGLTIANILANKGYQVDLIEEYSAFGGACIDIIDTDNNCDDDLYEQFHGSHIFHTNDKEVWDYLSKYTKWLPYQHRVKTLINGTLYPMPLNTEFIDEPLLTSSSELSFKELDELDSELSRHIFDVAFKDYSTKQWGTIPDKSVLDRVKALRTTNESRYFTDIYQGIPNRGFSEMFYKMQDNDNIYFDCSSYFDFDDLVIAKSKNIPVFFTGSIDALLQYQFGTLPYRTCDFCTKRIAQFKPQEAAVINYPSLAYDFTRSHDYSWYIPTKRATVSYEYPRDFDATKDSSIKRYYPINTEDSNAMYQKYVSHIKEHFPNVTLAGRQGLYKYMNMDQAVRSSLDIVNDYIKKNN